MATQGTQFRGLRAAAAAVFVLFMFGFALESLGLVRYASTSTGEINATVKSDGLRTGGAVPVSSVPERQPPVSTRKQFREPSSTVATGTRGILLCLRDRIIPLGISLITELRCLGNHERIHIYHCLGELTQANQALIQSVDANVEIIDVCEQLLGQQIMDRTTLESFRSYWLKPLALHQTTLDHALILDADALLLQDPATLRLSEQYIQNGTLFFHDRVINDSMYFNRDVQVDANTNTNGKEPYLHQFLRTFDYDRLAISGGFQPSHHLLHSFAYSGRSAHEMDSSMVLVRKSASNAALAMRVLWVLMTETRYDYEFSYGDKESFWLAYELAHAPYSFSPWGATVLSSQTNRDLETHASTLCGSLAHYVPNANAAREPELLYVNGKALIDPVPFDAHDLKNLRANLLFNMLPTHMSPRRPRTSPIGEKDQAGNRLFFSECLTGLGATPTPLKLLDALWRRRLHFMAISMNRLAPLQSCTN